MSSTNATAAASSFAVRITAAAPSTVAASDARTSLHIPLAARKTPMISSLPTAASVVGNRKQVPLSISRKRRRTSPKVKSGPFAYYIYKVLKQVHPNLSISAMAMSVMESFVMDFLQRIAQESKILIQRKGTQTLLPQTVAHASRLLIPRDLLWHALLEGRLAWEKYLRHESTSHVTQSRWLEGPSRLIKTLPMPPRRRRDESDQEE